eukprot:12442749-Alexandrium_andersonii.AAC.1
MRCAVGSTPARAKARLRCGCHRGPGVAEGEMRTDAPAISRSALMTLLPVRVSVQGVGAPLRGRRGGRPQR